VGTGTCSIQMPLPASRLTKAFIVACDMDMTRGVAVAYFTPAGFASRLTQVTGVAEAAVV